MADEKSLQDLERLTQDIIGRFEEALNVSKTSDLSSLVNDINKSLDKQVGIIQNINKLSSDHQKKTTQESQSVKKTTSEISKQSKLYGDILSSNEDISDNWENIIKKSATFKKNYDEINKSQKKHLIDLNLAVQKDKKLTESTFKRLKGVGDSQKKILSKKTGKSTKTPQFINVQGIRSSQLDIESLSGGKPYLASHPELGVPLGLFNTKDEPTGSSRVNAIKKYGTSGSLGTDIPQYADDLSSTKLQKPKLYTDEDLKSVGDAGSLIMKKIAAQLTAKYTEFITQIIGTVNQFGDKLEDFAGTADESIKSSIQAAGSLINSEKWEDMFDKEGNPLTRAAFFAESMYDAQKELNDEGINYNIEALGELQKAFSDYNVTNVLMGKKDLKNLAYIQTTFGLAASDAAEMQSEFMDIGLGSQDIIEYSKDLSNDARKFGVSATKLLKDLPKFLKNATSYRFRGGVKDMEKMQIYAARTKSNIESAYGIMDQAMSIEGAVDLASQLQVMGGAFTDISSIDLFSKALSDPEGFMKEITGRFRADQKLISYGGIDKETGEFKMSAQGFLRTRAFQKMEGFKEYDIEKIVIQAAKEDYIRQQLTTGVNKTSFLGYTKDEQDQIVANIAQGSTKQLNLTGQKINSLIDFSKTVLDEANKNLDIGVKTADGIMSTKDYAEINKTTVALQSQMLGTIDDVKTGLQQMKPILMGIGETILNVGLLSFQTPFYRAVEVLKDYVGLTTQEVILMYDLVKDGTLTKGLMGLADYALTLIGQGGSDSDDNKRKQELIDELKSPIDKKTGEKKSWTRQALDENATKSITNPYESRFDKYGGLLEAGGGIVMGSSHAMGGVRGMGRFNNVEVEGGEAIINKRSTAAFLPLLSKLNELGGGDALTTDKFNGGNTGNEKTINLNIDGKLNYNSNNKESGFELMELAKDLQDLTNGKSFDGAY
jgi:hypothetical protein